MKSLGHLLGLLVLGLMLPSLQAQTREDVTLNFVNADIESVARVMGQISGREVVLDPRVKGTLTLSSGKPTAAPVAYQLMVSALRLQGYAVVQSGGVIKVVPEAEARLHGGPVLGETIGSGDQIATRIYPLRHESAPQLVGVLKPLLSPNQSITASPGSNALVVTDTLDNLQRLERILATIDVASGGEPQVLPLRYASAVEVAGQLTRLFAPSGSQGTAGLVAMADARSNRVILRADNPGLLARAAQLVQSMDKPEAGLGNIRVVYLRNADAARMAQMLRTIVGGESGGPGGAAPRPTSPTPPAPAAGSAMLPTAATPLASLSGDAGAASGSALLPGSMIQADVANNALIITAPEPVFNNLQNVIAMLDRRRAQVHIEALIVELSSERAAEFGIQWQSLSGAAKAGTQVIGGTNFGGTGRNILGATVNPTAVGRGLNFGVVDGLIDIPGVGQVTNLRMLASFLESEANANILSTPSLLTLDNEEARIVIGQNLPFVTGSYSTTGGSTSVTPFQTFERRDVGLTLRVRPQISEGGVVRVQIYQEASSVQAGTASSSTGPITNKRSLESSVLVDDGSIIALGGLLEDSFGVNEEKVPLLGDIPLLGNLFRYENRTRKKTNLMVFLRPRIIRDAPAYQTLTEDRYDLLLQGQRQQQQRVQPLWGDPTVPLLPERSPAPAGTAPAL